MKPYIILLILILSGWKAFSQNSLSGKITGKESKETLVGASIYFPDLKKGGTTNNDGLYKITDLPAGKFLIEIRHIGYSIQVLRIEINGETKMDFELEESHKELNEVVVTGVSAATEKAINPVQTITINKISLNQNSSTNIIDAISHKPGMSQITTGAGISKPVIRGLGFNRVVVLQNNIRQEGQQWGDEHGIEIDEFSIDRVEIIKGPGSLIYGSDAMAGVINFLPPNPIEAGKINANFMTSYHSNNNQLGYSLQNAGNIKGVHWLIQGTRKEAGNYSNAFDGKVYNSGFNETNLNGSVGIAKKWGYSIMNFSTFNQNLGLIKGERDSSGRFTQQTIIADTLLGYQTLTSSELKKGDIGIPRQQINHHRISSTSNFILGKSRLAVTLGFQQNHRREIEFHDHGGKIKEEVGLYFLLNTINYDIAFHLPELNGWETSVGVNGFQQSSVNLGEDYLIPEYSLFDAGVFAVTRKSFDKLHLSGGLRYNTRSIDAKELLLNSKGNATTLQDTTATLKFASFNNTFSAIASSIGASYQFKEKVIGKINVSSGFRAPNIAELGSNGAHHGTFRYEIGDPNLKPETSLQIDAGFLFDTKHISFELGAFQNTIQNYIFSQKLNSVFGGDSIGVVDDGVPISAFKFVQGNANLLGGEITIDVHPHPFDWLHFENSFSFVQGVQNNQPDSLSAGQAGTKYLPFMPAPRFQSELRAQFKKAGKALRNFYVNVELDYFFEQNQFYSAYGTETKTPSYSLLNAGIGSDVVNKKGNTLFSIYFSATNILDVAYQSHLSRLKYAPENLATSRTGVFNMGRNFNIKLVVPLALKK